MWQGGSKALRITLKNGDVVEKNSPVVLADLCREIGKRLFEDSVAAKVNGQLVDLSRTVDEDSIVEFVTFKDPEALPVFRHSTSHVMAQAVKRLFPETQLAIGPAIENGFYYDFNSQGRIAQEILPRLEEEIKKIIGENFPFQRVLMTKPEAVKFFTERGEPLKAELIKDIPDEKVSIYNQGEFWDLCTGPHLPATGKIKAFKLLTVAGAYWRGNEKNQMLQRVYGTTFPTKQELADYLLRLEEAAKRDHRKLGKELDLFSVSDLIGPGLILWHPKGAMIRKVIEDYWRDEHIARGYELVYAPHIARVDLWKTSGHWDFYQDNMYKPIEVEEQQFMLKPMNCPFHIMIYKTGKRSYRELPVRYAEMGTVYRYERSGVLHGLMRVRGFTQDDAHIFCTPEQLPEEIENCVRLALDILGKFGFDQFAVTLSTGPFPSKAWEFGKGVSKKELYKKLMGETSDPAGSKDIEALSYEQIVDKMFGHRKNEFAGERAQWQQAEEVLARVLEKVMVPLGVKPEIDIIGGAFYGPKIDIKVKDALGREWQCSTIQFDFNLPRRFDITYVGQDGKEHMPYMVHRVMLGSFERFFGCLIEHYGGAFPFWLAPVQSRILPISEKHLFYAREVETRLRKSGIRIETDTRNEKIGAKIRDAQLQKIPYMLIVGDKEAQSNEISVRDRKDGDLGTMSVDDFLKKIGDRSHGNPHL